jgi:hypothetical protein
MKKPAWGNIIPLWDRNRGGGEIAGRNGTKAKGVFDAHRIWLSVGVAWLRENSTWKITPTLVAFVIN